MTMELNDEEHAEERKRPFKRKPDDDEKSSSEDSSDSDTAPDNGRAEQDVSEFRQRMQSRGGAASALQRVAAMPKKRLVAWADEYLRVGGTPTVLLDALAECRHADPVAAVAALKIISLIFLTALRKYPNKVTECELAACRLVQSSSTFLNFLLSSKNPPSRTATCLRFLTAVCSLSVKVTKEVLKVINLDRDTIKYLTEGPLRRQDRDPKVRRHFLHLVMSFMVHKDPTIYQILLSKSNLLGTTMKGLGEDRANIVHNFLTTVMGNFVQCPSVHKKLRQDTFHTGVLEALVSLYEWKGATLGAAKGRNRKKAKIQQSTEKDVKLVRERVNSFLKTLLTNYKVGLVYPTKNTDCPVKHNHHALSVLMKLSRPWDCPLKTDMVIECLRACPTLVKPVLANYAEALAPRPTQTWLRTLNFAIQVLDSVSLDAFVDVKDGLQLSSKKLAAMIVNICFPVKMLKAVIVPGLSHTDIGVQEGAARLANCLFSNCNRHLVAVKNCNSVQDVENILSNHLSDVLPPGQIVWDAGIKVTTYKSAESSKKFTIVEGTKLFNIDLPTPDLQTLPLESKLQGYSTFLDLQIGYLRWLPTSLEADFECSKKALKLLTSAKEDFEQEEDQEMVNSLQLKAICVYSRISSSVLDPTQEVFQWAVPILVHSCPENLEARRALKSLLEKLCLLLDNEDELDIWIFSCQGEKENLDFLATALILLAKNQFTNLHLNSNINSRNEAFNQVLSKVSSTSCWYQDSGLSPLLVVLMHLSMEKAFAKRKDAIEELLSRVMLRLLFHQSHPDYFANLLLDNYPKKFANLVQSLSKVPEDLLSAEEKSMWRFLSGKSQKFPKLEESTTPEGTKQLCRMVIFSCVLKQTETFDEKARNAHKEALKKLFERLSPESQQKCLELLVRHPELQKTFSLKASTLSSQMITSFLMEIAIKVGDLSALDDIKETLLEDLAQNLHSSQLDWLEHQALYRLMLHLNLSTETVQELLQSVKNIPVSKWSKSNKKKSLPATVLASLMERILVLEKESFEPSSNLTPMIENLDLVNLFVQILTIPNDDHLRLEDAMVKYFTEHPPTFLNKFSSGIASQLLSKGSKSMLVKLFVDKNLFEQKQIEDWAKKADLSSSLPLFAIIRKNSTEDLQKFELILWNKVKVLLNDKMLQNDQLCDLFSINLNEILHLVDKFKSNEKPILWPALQEEMTDPWLAELTCRIQSGNPKLAEFLLKSLTNALNQQKIDLISKLCHLVQIHLSEELKGNLDFFKAALKVGINGNTEVMKTVACVVSKMDDTNTLTAVLEMLLGHSKTLTVLFGHNDSQKRGILLLWDVLTEKNLTLVKSRHMPILLGAYNASLSENDSIVFQILMRYDAKGASLQEPLVWGEEAVTHFSLRVQTGHSLQNQITPSQVLKALNSDIMANTLAQFPLSRGLGSEGKFQDFNSKIYDPAFLLTVFSYILRPESLIQPWLFARHALPLVLMSLSSEKEDMRQLALVNLARLYFHFEAGRLTFEKKQWLHFLNTVRNTVNSAEGKRLPCVVALFLARASQISSNPEQELYKTLNRFLLAKPALDTNVLPEFLRMMHSPDPGHKTQRHWMLELLRDGMRSPEDFELFFSQFAFKTLACLYNSSFVDFKTKIEVLHVLTAVVKIPNAAKRLASGGGFLSWLQGAVFTLPPPPTKKDSDCPLAEAILTLITTFHTHADPATTSFSILDSGVQMMKRIPAQAEIVIALAKLLNLCCDIDAKTAQIFNGKEAARFFTICKQANVEDDPQCRQLLRCGRQLLAAYPSPPSDQPLVGLSSS